VRRSGAILTTAAIVLMGLVAWTWSGPVGRAMAEGDSSTATAAMAGATATRSDLFRADRDITLNGEVTGDAYLAGSTVTVDGVVDGDLYVAAGTITINGKIHGSLRAVGSKLVLNGSVDRTVSLAGADITIGEQATVGGNLYLAGSTLVVGGHTAGIAKLAGGSMVVSGRIDRYLDVAGTSLSLGSASHVGGDLNYWSSTDLSATSGAVVTGQTTRHDPPKAEYTASSASAERASVIWSLLWLASTIVSAVVLFRLAPARGLYAGRELMANLWPSILVGFGFVVLAPIVAVILMITLIGLPLGLILLGVYLLMLFTGPMVSALWVAHKLAELLRQTIDGYLAVVGGLLAIWVLGQIPILGVLFGFLCLCAGTGALLRSLWRDRLGGQIVPLPVAPPPEP
jgi:cytoskeletal protein CcmA (bactofilin family)